MWRAHWPPGRLRDGERVDSLVRRWGLEMPDQIWPNCHVV